jgi:hypothetical protein
VDNKSSKESSEHKSKRSVQGDPKKKWEQQVRRDVTHNEGWMGDPGKKLMRWRTVGRQRQTKRLGCQTAHKNWKMIFGRRRIGRLAS